MIIKEDKNTQLMDPYNKEQELAGSVRRNNKHLTIFSAPQLLNTNHIFPPKSEA